MNPGAYHFSNHDHEVYHENERPQSSFDINPNILPNVINIGNARKTVLISGPIGCGKTSLLNTLLGFSLLPEGIQCNTSVPTVLVRGESFEIKALGRNGRPLLKILPLKLKNSQASQDIPKGSRSVRARLKRKNDTLASLGRRWKSFWKPVNDAAKAGQCLGVKATVPARWLPKNLRLVDIPGYAGWLPEESPELHQLLTTLMDSADHTVFVFEREKLKLEHALEYFARQINSNRSVSLVISKMDEFNPYKVENVPKSHKPGWMAAVWDTHCQQIRQHICSEYGCTDKTSSIFFGASRLSCSKDQRWLSKRIISKMDRFYQKFRNMLLQV